MKKKLKGTDQLFNRVEGIDQIFNKITEENFGKLRKDGPI